MTHREDAPGRLSEYRPDIDGLRAVSILAVVMYHARYPGFEAGYLGVDVFFVVSGFLITGQLLSEREITGTIHMGHFYARRVRRLLPAFVAMMVGSAILVLACLDPMNEQRLFGNAAVRSALFYYNIAVWRGGYEYDEDAAEQQVLMHTWSLGVEEQFYLIWPCVCLVVARISRPLAAFSALTTSSLLGAWWRMPEDESAVFFLLPFRVWELGLGACLAARKWSFSPRISGVAAFAGAVCLAVTLFSGEARPPDLRPALAASASTALVIAFGKAPNPAGSFLRTRPMVYLGRMSYAWYLWHWPVLMLARAVTFSAETNFHLDALIAGFVLALLTHVWIEKPTLLIPIKDPYRTLVWGATGIASIVVLGRTIELRSEGLMGRPSNVALLERLAATQGGDCETKILELGCDLSRNGNGDARTLLLLGDSFARALSPALFEYSRIVGIKTRILVQPGCPPLIGAISGSRKTPSEVNPECRDWLRQVQERLRDDLSGISGVILAGRWPAYAARETPEASRKLFDWNGRVIEGSVALSVGMQGTLDFMESVGVRVLVVGAPPESPFDVSKCLLRAPDRCYVTSSWNETARALSKAALIGVVRGRGNVRYTDLFDALCPGLRCSFGTIEDPLLTDRSHLSASAAKRRVLPTMLSDLEWLRGTRARDFVPGPALR